MFELDTVIKNPTGLHARPAAQLSALCKSFPNEITLTSSERKANPKSIFSLLSGCFVKGETVRIGVEGENAQEIAEKIAAFIETLEG
ncbi:MAG: HPr family phosphocarrier protein [Christensenella sp.]|nr:HPr family phosphocarrier protein [Christensenella sp.]